jgi:hypothetical protein
MLISMTNLRKLNTGFCFVVNSDGFISIETYDEKAPLRSGTLMTRTPRVRMLGTRLGDEKSHSYKDIKAEFSWHVFPRWAFFYDPEERMIGIGFEEYRIGCFSGENHTVERMTDYSDPI